MAKHRLHGAWWNPSPPVVFATPLGLFVNSARGAVGSAGRPINIGQPWTDFEMECYGCNVDGPLAEWEIELHDAYHADHAIGGAA
jgi:hypothetical protein